MLNLNDLLTGTPSSRSETLSRFAGSVRCGVADPLITRGLLVNLLRKARGTVLNLKDFLAGLLSNSRAPSSGLVGRPKRGEADLLIMRGLTANSLRKKREDLLNLKDLLTVLPPSLERSFEHEPRFEASFLCRIEPNPAVFRQKRADNRRKSRFFATNSGGTCQGYATREASQRIREQGTGNRE